MSSTAIFWAIYVAGYFVWFSYAVSRFYRVRGDAIPQALLALMWPACVALYLPYRLARWAVARQQRIRGFG